jgi:hypothetical protein
MTSVSNLGYLVLGVSDLDAWERFAVDIIGLQAGRRVKGESLALRMDDYAQRILLEKSPEDDLLAAGWEFDSDEELDVFVDRVRQSGAALNEAEPELASRRCVPRLFTCIDPDGVSHDGAPSFRGDCKGPVCIQKAHPPHSRRSNRFQ